MVVPSGNGEMPPMRGPKNRHEDEDVDDEGAIEGGDGDGRGHTSLVSARAVRASRKAAAADKAIQSEPPGILVQDYGALLGHHPVIAAGAQRVARDVDLDIEVCRPPPGLPMRVLCVDDERSNRRYIAAAVRKLGVPIVMEASDGLEALRVLGIPAPLIDLAQNGQVPSRKAVRRNIMQALGVRRDLSKSDATGGKSTPGVASSSWGT